MKNLTWIPQKNEVVTFNNQPHKLLSMDMGGKCTVRLMVGKARKVIKNVDLSELSKIES